MRTIGVDMHKNRKLLLLLCHVRAFHHVHPLMKFENSMNSLRI